MNNQILDRLAELIQRDRAALLAQWRSRVRMLPSAQHLDTPTLNDHVPTLLDELCAALRSHNETTIPETLRNGSPPAHGMQRFRDGFDVEEVVAEYNILRDCIHDLADCQGIQLQGKPFHILNRVLDHAIGLAVQTYAASQARNIHLKREEYLAFVAHDLRTPLNAISLSASVLELTLPPQGVSAETLQMLRTLQRNASHLEVLIRKIIDENANLKAEAGVMLHKRALDLWPIVESMLQELQPLAETADTRLKNQVPFELSAYADADVLKRIFQNLLANAIKYTARGEVTVVAESVGTDGTVECSVCDNGVGINPAELDKIFDKGETDKLHEGGLGLGLAIVRSLTEAHGGKVFVESTAGVGSTFRFILPGQSAQGSALAERCI